MHQSRPPLRALQRIALLLGVLLTNIPLAHIEGAGSWMWMGTARAETPPKRTVFVVDGSGSMWATLGNEPGAKIERVQKALRALLGPVTPAGETGLISFGHRRRGDCNDAEVIVPPSAGPIERILAQTDKLNPKGMGPIGMALQQATALFPAGTTGSIILIHDGADNCSVDPCPIADELAKVNAQVPIHTIAIGLEKAAAEKMACVSAKTNGRRLDVAEASALDGALSEVIRLAALDTQSVAATAAAAQPKPGDVPGLQLSAALRRGGPAIADPIKWRVTREDPAGEVLIERLAPTLVADLSPGLYAVEAALGIAKVQEKIRVEESGKTVQQLRFNAGVIKLSLASNGSAEPPSNATISIGSMKGASEELITPVWLGRDPRAAVIVPEGSYRVVIEDGLLRHETTLAIEAGQQSDVSVALASGRLELSARRLSDAVSDIVYTVFEDDPEADLGRREVTSTAAPQPSFTLPVGTYYVTARHGAAEVRERVAVTAGATIKHLVVFDAARLHVAVETPGFTPSGSTPLLIRVLDRADPKVELERSTGGAGTFVLPPGSYMIEARLGSDPALVAVPVELKANEDRKLPVVLETAEVTIDATSAASPNVRWSVREESGRSLVRSVFGRSRVARLSPGQYVVHAETAQGIRRYILDLKAGERQRLGGS